jgi:hypothetical protein
MRWAVPEACMQDWKYILVHNFIIISDSEIDQSRDLKVQVGWKIILKCIFNKEVMRMWTGFNWIRMDSCEDDREPSGYMKYAKFLINRKMFSFSRRTLAHGVQTCNIPVSSLYKITI